MRSNNVISFCKFFRTRFSFCTTTCTWSTTYKWTWTLLKYYNLHEENVPYFPKAKVLSTSRWSYHSPHYSYLKIPKYYRDFSDSLILLRIEVPKMAYHYCIENKTNTWKESLGIKRTHLFRLQIAFSHDVLYHSRK